MAIASPRHSKTGKNYRDGLRSYVGEKDVKFTINHYIGNTLTASFCIYQNTNAPFYETIA